MFYLGGNYFHLGWELLFLFRGEIIVYLGGRVTLFFFKGGNYALI